jgi:hypothetical protein
MPHAWVQMLLDTLLKEGMGLSACWAVMVVFHVLRLCANGVWLLRPGSVLSQTTPLQAMMQADGDDAVEASASIVAEAA